MSKILEGGCQCGKVRYRVTGAPLTLYACHCTECQKQSASAFGLSLWVKRSDLEILSGEPKYWERSADSGNTTLCAFCPVCGSTVYWQSESFGDVIVVAVGAFADPQFPSPQIAVWEETRHAWFALPADVPPKHAAKQG